MRFLALGGTTVGASCYLFELGGIRLLIDCGVQPGLTLTRDRPQSSSCRCVGPPFRVEPTQFVLYLCRRWVFGRSRVRQYRL